MNVSTVGKEWIFNRNDDDDVADQQQRAERDVGKETTRLKEYM